MGLLENIDDGVSGAGHHGRESYPAYAGRFAMQIIPEGVTYDDCHVVSIFRALSF